LEGPGTVFSERLDLAYEQGSCGRIGLWDIAVAGTGVRLQRRHSIHLLSDQNPLLLGTYFSVLATGHECSSWLQSGL
jgi:hypothetical protein